MATIRSELELDVDRLMTWLSQKFEVPTYSDTRLIALDPKNTDIDGTGKIKIFTNEFVTLSGYKDTYKEKLQSGYTWINLNCAGIYDEEFMIFMIEYPSSPSGASRTSVNHSGPHLDPTTRLPVWDFRKNYIIK